MAVNNNGNLLDTAGEVAIDFVWGNFPIQPNDARPDAASATLSESVTTRVAGRLAPALDNHIIALSGWGGYPQFTANSAGEDVVGATNYVLVPNVLGLTTALATDAMKDASLVPTTATAASNVGKTITAAARTAGSAVISITCASHGFVAGNKVTVSDVSGGDGVNGVWTVLAVTNANVFTVTGTATTVQALTSLAGVVSGVAGTIKTQSIAAGANEIAPAAAVTITPFAAAS
jgi:hypothetical protein